MQSDDDLQLMAELLIGLTDAQLAMEDMVMLLLSHLRGSTEPTVQNLRSTLENLRDQRRIQPKPYLSILAGRLADALDASKDFHLPSLHQPTPRQPSREALRHRMRVLKGGRVD